MTGFPVAKAEKLKELLLEISPCIEEYTSQVCPGCTDVCCKQKRSFPDPVDVRYSTALGEALPTYNPTLPPDGPCQFMGPHGCMTPRWRRPWRCTWYFCDPLLDALDKGSQKRARFLSRLIREIIDIRSSL